MNVVATHTNPDWDAIGCLLMTRKLYPGAALIVPEPHGELLTSETTAAMLRSLRLKKAEEISFADVDRLILVGTRRPDNIGGLVALAENPDIELHLYDNHPRSPVDLEGTMEVTEKTGACVTIVLQLLLARGLKLMPDEATWALLGLFEKTGGLTLPHTTSDDFRAAAQLLDFGADLEVVATTARQAMSSDETVVLADLLRSARPQQIGRLRVVVGETAAPSDVDVHRCAARLHALRAGDVTIVAVTHTDAMTVFAFTRPGRGALASLAEVLHVPAEGNELTAIITGRKTGDVLKELVDAAMIGQQRNTCAADLMSPPDSLPPSLTVEQAARRFVMGRESTMLVADETGKPAFLLSLTDATCALHHGLGPLPVTQLAFEEQLDVLPASATVPELFPVVRDIRQAIFPVMSESRFVGLLSRETVLRATADEFFVADTDQTPTPQTTAGADKRYAATMRKLLRPDAHETVVQIAAQSEALETRAFLVGGVVRDLLLGRGNQDLDVVVEGDAAALAHAFAEAVGGRVVEHEQFGTATAYGPAGSVDFAGARREWYDEPGALPSVEAASLDEDLARRDFSINAMALALHPSEWGHLIDPFDGRRDLLAGRMRVLHPLSFVEDPTRLFRGARFAQRFGFRFSAHTDRLYDEAVAGGYVNRVEPARLWKEMQLVFGEEDAAAVLVVLTERGVLAGIHPSFAVDDQSAKTLTRAQATISWYRRLDDVAAVSATHFWLAVLTLTMSPAEKAEWAPGLPLAENTMSEIAELQDAAVALRERLVKRPPHLTSQLAALREQAPPAALLATVFDDQDIASQNVKAYFSSLARIKPELTGDDLVKMGLEPGPVFKQILDEVRDAKLDGKVDGKMEELRLAKQIWARLSPSP